ncbi:hypothetical protein CDAR_267271 [Caerostris darwini]|uniref:Uncharacterized protein n=1 Tax=Caerostris darwini TaxID=1538125 RepID=A0AAV4TFA1_9ARAC|nr:hypothetical protein CDAR_267271 [Caerostris darwini]
MTQSLPAPPPKPGMVTYLKGNHMQDRYRKTNILFLSLLLYREGIKEAISRQKNSRWHGLREGVGVGKTSSFSAPLDCGVRQVPCESRPNFVT